MPHMRGHRIEKGDAMTDDQLPELHARALDATRRYVAGIAGAMRPSRLRTRTAAQRKGQLRLHQRPRMRLTHSGTAQSAAEPCTSSNGSPPCDRPYAPESSGNATMVAALP